MNEMTGKEIYIQHKGHLDSLEKGHNANGVVDSEQSITPHDVEGYRVPDNARPLPEAPTSERRARSEEIAAQQLSIMRNALKAVAEGREPPEKLPSTLSDKEKAPGE